MYSHWFTGQPGYHGPKGEKGISIKGEPGYPGRPGYLLHFVLITFLSNTVIEFKTEVVIIFVL